MNYLLFKNSEVQFLQNSAHITLTGERARYIRDRHQISQTGISVKAGIIHGKLGQVTVSHIEDLQSESPVYVFQGTFDKEPPQRNNITLIIGVPRPQTVKKIIQLAVSFGIKEILFLRMEKTIPSYCDSKIWADDALQHEVLEALEQTGDTIPPTYILNGKAHFFARDEFHNTLALFDEVTAYDGEWNREKSFDLQSCNATQSKALIFGPEAGFSLREREWIYNQNKIMKAGLGERMLRLEHAVACALARKTIQHD